MCYFYGRGILACTNCRLPDLFILLMYNAEFPGEEAVCPSQSHGMVAPTDHLASYLGNITG